MSHQNPQLRIVNLFPLSVEYISDETDLDEPVDNLLWIVDREFYEGELKESTFKLAWLLHDAVEKGKQ